VIYLLIQVLTVALCVTCYRSIRHHAKWYYVGSIALVALFYYGALFGLPEPVWRPLYHLIKQCMLGMAFFVVVMFVGALPPDHKVTKNLRSIRGELSIIAWILCLGHLIYLVAIPPMVDIALRIHFIMPAAAIGMVLSIVLLVLLVVLGVTSFRSVKRHMTNKSWKALQWWAYPFYAITYVHLMLMLGPSLAQGSIFPIITASVYTLIFVGYLVLRVRRFKIDKAQKVAKAEKLDEPTRDVVEDAVAAEMLA